MKKILYWTLGIHLITQGFASSLLAGLAYKELDQVRETVSYWQEYLAGLEKIVKLFLPWM